MKIHHNNKDKTEVYSISGFKDTLASPVFYPVIVVAMLLGITSILGFVQNPMKLKSMVNVIHQKVNVNHEANQQLDAQLYSVLKKANTVSTHQDTQALDIFSNEENKSKKISVDKSIERIAFNYDLTSENFWTDLDSSKLETAKEEMERKEKESNSIGAPLEINKLEKLPSKYKLNDKSIYALGYTAQAE